MANPKPEGGRPEHIIDCHVHVIGDGGRYPYIAGRAYEPRPASLGDLLGFHDRWHVGHAVLVQVSVHGTDNGLMLEALAEGGERFRGVAVVDLDATDALLARLKDAGVVGLRINMNQGGGPGSDHLERYAAICRDAGFHLQIYPDGRMLADLAPRLARLGVPLVLDHFGGVPASLGPAHPAFQAVLDLVRGGAWVKLSGPYRISAESQGFEDTIPLGRALLGIAPDRCVWASDWPHVATDRTIDMGGLLDLAQAMAGPADAEALFSDNAKRLYGF